LRRAHPGAAVLLVTLAVVCVGGACRTAPARSEPPIVQPGAPGESSRVISADRAVDLSRVQYTAADVRFMQNMIGHHAQALEMTALLGSRTESADMRKLALRIEVSQADEIKMMRDWLEARGVPAAGEHAHHMPAAGMQMPGMLTPEEMQRLAASRGSEFDRMFLEFMIRHHEGALIMVKELFSTPGAGQESEIFAFASEVDADQRMEIDRMRAVLKELQK
jgi:uncharacterized protein (DUF305 family)